VVQVLLLCWLLVAIETYLTGWGVWGKGLRDVLSWSVILFFIPWTRRKAIRGFVRACRWCGRKVWAWKRGKAIRAGRYPVRHLLDALVTVAILLSLTGCQGMANTIAHMQGFHGDATADPCDPKSFNRQYCGVITLPGVKP